MRPEHGSPVMITSAICWGEREKPRDDPTMYMVKRKKVESKKVRGNKFMVADSAAAAFQRRPSRLGILNHHHSLFRVHLLLVACCSRLIKYHHATLCRIRAGHFPALSCCRADFARECSFFTMPSLRCFTVPSHGERSRRIARDQTVLSRFYSALRSKQ